MALGQTFEIGAVANQDQVAGQPRMHLGRGVRTFQSGQHKGCATGIPLNGWMVCEPLQDKFPFTGQEDLRLLNEIVSSGWILENVHHRLAGQAIDTPGHGETLQPGNDVRVSHGKADAQTGDLEDLRHGGQADHVGPVRIYVPALLRCLGKRQIGFIHNKGRFRIGCKEFGQGCGRQQHPGGIVRVADEDRVVLPGQGGELVEIHGEVTLLFRQ